MNSCEFIGNLGNDPETKASEAKGTSFTTFSIAVNKRGAGRDDKPLWVNVTAFGKTGENAALYLKKGSKVFVRGTLELQEYEGKDGKNHTSVKVLANEVEYLDKKEGSDTATATASAGASASKAPAKAAVVTDEDIPF